MSQQTISQAFAAYPPALALLGALALLALTVWRPAIGLAVYAFSISLTTGLGRGTILPVLRPNEAILLVVGAGLGLHYLPRRQRHPITGLDLAVRAYAVAPAVIPGLVLLAPHRRQCYHPTTLSPA